MRKSVLVVVYCIMIALTGATGYGYMEQRSIVDNFCAKISSCESVLDNMINELIEGGSIKSHSGKIYNISRSSVENCEIIEKGVFMLDDGNIKGVLVYLDNFDSVVYLVEVFFDKDDNILSVRKTERGVLL